MFNQTSINDFFPKKTSGNNSDDLTLPKNDGFKGFFPSDKSEINIIKGNNEGKTINKESNKEETLNNKGSQFKNIFSDGGIIERVEVFTDGSTINNGKKKCIRWFWCFFLRRRI